MYQNYFKRLIDIVFSLIGLIVFLIPIMFISIAIKLDSRGPVIFKQQRVGKGETVFEIYKFRTMVVGAYELGGIVMDSSDNRITPIGSFLRRTSLDEILQFYNILKGDMSIIGPRPILPIEFDEYRHIVLYQKRHIVRPGLFCTVDIDYRAAADRILQFNMDIDYICSISFSYDLKIFFKIIKVILSQKNIYKHEV